MDKDKYEIPSNFQKIPLSKLMSIDYNELERFSKDEMISLVKRAYNVSNIRQTNIREKIKDEDMYGVYVKRTMKTWRGQPIEKHQVNKNIDLIVNDSDDRSYMNIDFSAGTLKKTIEKNYNEKNFINRLRHMFKTAQNFLKTKTSKVGNVREYVKNLRKNILNIANKARIEVSEEGLRKLFDVYKQLRESGYKSVIKDYGESNTIRLLYNYIVDNSVESKSVDYIAKGVENLLEDIYNETRINKETSEDEYYKSKYELRGDN